MLVQGPAGTASLVILEPLRSQFSDEMMRTLMIENRANSIINVRIISSEN